MSLKHLINIVICAGALLFTACGGPGSASDSDDELLGPDQAKLDVINAAPDSDAFDLYVNEKLTTSVDYRKATGFLKVKAGDVKVDIRLKGAPLNSTALVSTTVRAAAYGKLSLAVIGRVAATLDINPSDELKLRLLPLLSGAADGAAVKLRVLHAVPSAPVLDVSTDAGPVVNAVSFADLSSYAAFDAERAAASKIAVRLRGSAFDAAFATLSRTRPRGSVITAIAFGEILPTSSDHQFLGISLYDEQTGELSDLPLSINVSGPRSSFYLFNGALDVDRVDLTAAGGGMLVENVGYQQASPILEVNPGVLPIELRTAGTSNVAMSGALKLLPGTNWSIFASGLASAGSRASAKLTLSSDVWMGASLGAHARIANCVFDVTALDVMAGADSWAKALVYGKTGGYVQLAGGFQVGLLSVRAAIDFQTIVTTALNAAFLEAGRDQVVTFFVSGAADPTLGKPISVVAVVESELTTKALPVVPLPSF